MPKVRPHSIAKEDKFKIIGNLFEVISNLKSKKESIDFFIGLLSPSEALMLARRMQIAQMLLRGENYELIRKALRVSNQTITKTDQWLHSGDEKNDRWLAECITKTNKQRLRGEGIGMLDKYAHHRFLKELLK